MVLSSLLMCVCLCQKGDVPGEPQGTLPADLRVPAAAPRTAAEELATFSVPAGYALELAASEPQIEAPVQAVFDDRGRLWVVEMRGYMPDVDGSGETEPRGRIAVLTDQDGDGRFETRTTFLEGLVLATTVLPVPGGALVVEPPALWLCLDTDGDGRCDRRVQLLADIAGQNNPEHGGNHLTWGLDNWIWFANHPRRLRADPAATPGGYRLERSVPRGQWGLSFDDLGRPYFDYNSDYLFTSFVPLCYVDAAGTNERVDTDQRVWPARITPGVNRGYQKGILADWKLARFTAACAPHVYRGDALPELTGSVFVCEPAANLVRRTVVTEVDGTVTGRNACGESEFLTATDERFRPVDLTTGPDGALYVVDMYRGVIQHRNFVTTWLRRQIVARGLEAPLDRGRIWRLRRADARPAARPVTGRSPAQLVAALSSANGWERDAAQRLLVQHGAGDALPALRALALAPDVVVPRVHALWTLAGLGALTATELGAALAAAAAPLRAHGLRLCEAAPALLPAHPELGRAVLALLQDPARPVRVQAALSLGALGLDGAPAALVATLVRGGDDAFLRQAAVSAGSATPARFAALLAAAAPTTRPALVDALRALGRLTAQGRSGERLAALLAALPVPGVAPWQQAAVLEGIAQGRPRGAQPVLDVPAEPAALLQLLAVAAPDVRRHGSQVAAFLRWPGKPEAQSRPGLKLDAAQLLLYTRGQDLFRGACSPCHQPGGEGRVGLAPPFLGSSWVAGPADRMVRILLHGVHGPIEVAGSKWELEMPSFAWLDDTEIAAVLTFVRSEWGEGAGPVAPPEVTALRRAHAERGVQWTAEELLK